MAGTQYVSEAQSQALDAESRIQQAPTQDEREYWQRMADYWWEQTYQCDADEATA